MMLLTTKLYLPPPQPQGMSRPRLLNILEAGLPRKLTLIVASVGSGKTTAASEMVRHVGLPCAWLSLDAGDNDPIHFWHYVLTALRTVQPTLGRAWSMLSAPQPPPLSTVVTALLNELRATHDADATPTRPWRRCARR